jgi:hypothetical protein
MRSGPLMVLALVLAAMAVTGKVMYPQNSTQLPLFKYPLEGEGTLAGYYSRGY